MAGHSKWANIQHRKSAQDAKRGKIFTKLIRELTVAARLGGSDPAGNPRLRLAIDKALDANMPKDTIERAIKRGSGVGQEGHFESVRYEGYGPGGAAVIVECLTDNRTRTVGEVRHVLARHGGHLGTDGSVAFLFTRRGVLLFAPGSDEDRIMEVALESGADDVQVAADGSIEVLTSPEAFLTVKAAMAAARLEPAQAEIVQRANSTVFLSGDSAQTMQRLLEALEDLDDVQAVYSNAEWD